MKVTEAFARRTCNLLAAKGMTPYRLARNIAMHLNTIYSITEARNKTITLTTVLQICRGLNVTMAEFMDDPIFESPELDID